MTRDEIMDELCEIEAALRQRGLTDLTARVARAVDALDDLPTPSDPAVFAALLRKVSWLEKNFGEVLFTAVQAGMKEKGDPADPPFTRRRKHPSWMPAGVK